jgi:TPR repeat protein
MSVPISDYAEANEELAKMDTEEYYSCCGKSICGGCVHSFYESGNNGKCPFCNDDRDITDEEAVEEVMKRVEAKDAGAMCQLGCYYYNGNGSLHEQHGLQQDREKALELYTRAAKLGSSEAHFHLAGIYYEGGDLKKEKFHYEAAAMAGHEVARYNLGIIEYEYGNKERALKHLKIAASAGYYLAMNNLLDAFKKGLVSRESIDSILVAYNNSCVEMRSEARDAYIRVAMEINEST